MRIGGQDDLFHRLESEYMRLSAILDETHRQRCAQLRHAAARLELWAHRLERERCVVVAMNAMRHDRGKRCWVGHAWVAVEVRELLF